MEKTIDERVDKKVALTNEVVKLSIEMSQTRDLLLECNMGDYKKLRDKKNKLYSALVKKIAECGAYKIFE